jgi:NAD(P)-dependent dehydrogenase (short-subunit alcohol dehydrogenase family)
MISKNQEDQEIACQMPHTSATAEKRRLPVCVVLGVGPGNGMAFTERFSKLGYAVAMIARSLEFTKSIRAKLPNTYPYVCDLIDSSALKDVFADIETRLGDIDVLIYNAGKGLWGSAEDVSPEDFETCWRVNALGSYIAVQCVIPSMKLRGMGTIIFIGATASRRGAAHSVAFASAKAAQKSVAESLARLLGPSGIHVSLVVLVQHSFCKFPAPV